MQVTDYPNKRQEKKKKKNEKEEKGQFIFCS